MDRRHLPLQVIEIAQPCSQSWEAMRADDRKRFCEHCGLYVHDLSALRPDQVEDLMCRSAGRLCVRFERNRNGAVKTLDYETRSARGGRAKWWLAAGTLAALVAAAAELLRPRPPVLMGVVARPVTTSGNRGSLGLPGAGEATEDPHQDPCPNPR